MGQMAAQGLPPEVSYGEIGSIFAASLDRFLAMNEFVADPNTMQTLTAVAAGLGLSAAAGFRVFVPLFIMSVCQRFGIAIDVPLAEDFEWLSSWPAMVMFGVATLAEVGAYYVPWVDNLLDTIATPAAIVSGTLISASVMPAMPDAVQWAGALLVGGGSAGIVQGGTVLLRAGSTATSGGLANPAVSTGEAGGAVATSILAMLIPLILAVILLIAFVFIGIRLIKFFRDRKRTPAGPPAPAGG